jgi:proteasome lid subunit RPN8/RPN11
MNFSIKAIIRARVVPRLRLSCAKRLWNDILAELERRGGSRHEAGVFLLGKVRGGHREVQAVIFYDDLDSEVYSSGVCVLHGDAFAKLWAVCREKKLTVVADAHTHPGGAFQSSSDKANPMVACPGHIAIIIPNYAQAPVNPRSIRIYEYCGHHDWTDRSPSSAPGFLYTGFWS